MDRRKSVAAILAVAVVLGKVGVAAAADDRAIRARAAEPPSLVTPILGVAIAAVGAYLNYRVSVRAADGDERCLDVESSCYWALIGTPYLGFAGGAMVAYYGWRLGEHHAWRDLQGGGAMKETRGMAVGGLLVGGAMLLANLAMSQYVVYKVFSCESRDIEGMSACFGQGLETMALVQLGTNAVLLGTAPFVAYGFAYDSYRDRYGVEARLAPAVLPGGAGLTFRGTF